jgi:hypothetical protein
MKFCMQVILSYIANYLASIYLSLLLTTCIFFAGWRTQCTRSLRLHMMAAIVHTFSLTSTRYLQNVRHFLYIMSRFFLIGLYIANVVIIEFYCFFKT